MLSQKKVEKETKKHFFDLPLSSKFYFRSRWRKSFLRGLWKNIITIAIAVKHYSVNQKVWVWISSMLSSCF